MARKPVHLIAAAKRPEGRQVIWTAMRKLREFTIPDIEGETRINEGTIRTYIRGLQKAGYIEAKGRKDSGGHLMHVKNSFESMIYALVRDIGVEAPRVTRDGRTVTQGAAREQMWRTMHIVGDFNYRELAMNASTEDTRVKVDDAKDYVKHLHRAGYLILTAPDKRGNKPGTGRPARYRLIPSKYTGPKPPMVQRIKQVYDPNLGKVVWPKGGAQ